MIAHLRLKEEAGQRCPAFFIALTTRPDREAKSLIIDGDPALLIPSSRAVRLN